MIYNIWSEGYLCTGMEGRPAPANLHGTQEANNFQEACDLFFSKKENDSENSYNKENLTFWGCSLYDNENEARRSFG